MKFEIDMKPVSELAALFASRAEAGWTLQTMVASPFQNDYMDPVFVLVWKL